MKFQWDKKYTTIALYVGIVLALGILCVFFFLNIRSVFGFFGKILGVCTPITIGAVMAYILNPLLRLYENRVFVNRKEKERLSHTMRRTLGVVATMLTFFILIGLFIWMILPQLAQSIKEFGNKLPTYATSLTEWANEISAQGGAISDMIGAGIEYLRTFYDRSYDILADLLPKLTDAVQSVAATVLDVLLGIVFAVYFLFAKERLAAQAKKLLSALVKEKSYHKICDIVSLADTTFSRYFSGAILDSVLVGIECFVMMWIFGMPYSPLISVVVGVTNIIPFFGPFIGSIPSAIILFVAKPSYAFWFVVGVLVIQQIDGNIIAPRIHGVSTGLSPTWVIVAITVTSGLFGIVGMFIGVPFCSVIYVLVKKEIEDRLASKGMVTETVAFMSPEEQERLAEEETKRAERREQSPIRERLRKIVNSIGVFFRGLFAKLPRFPRKKKNVPDASQGETDGESETK